MTPSTRRTLPDERPGEGGSLFELPQRARATRETDASSATAATGTGKRGGCGCPSVSVSGRALLTVTIDHQWLQKQLGHGVLDSDQPISPTSARRLACDAGIVPLVLGGRGEPLDVGRLAYTVPEPMRRALHARDGGCTFPGCTRRPRRCHAHHLRHWIDGGETTIDNLALLCLFHHQLVHHQQWHLEMIDGRPWYRPPAWIDPRQQWRPGGRHPLPDTTPDTHPAAA